MSLPDGGYSQCLGIIGSRFYGKIDDDPSKEPIRQIIQSLDKSSTLVVSGGCPSGADYWCKFWCGVYGVPYVEAVANWRTSVGGRLDRKAGLKRNVIIARMCTRLIAFWDGKSTGTGHTVTTARALGRPVKVVNLNDIHPLAKLDKPLRPPQSLRSTGE